MNLSSISVMRIVTGRVIVFATIGTFVACLVLFSLGCSNGFSKEKVDQIDEAFRAGASRYKETTAFIGAMEDFDFENAAFMEAASSALDASREAAQDLLASAEELRGFTYGGALSSLGGYVEEYTASVIEAVEELNAIYSGFQEILLAIEPIMREEALITQLEAPGNDAELLDRLQGLDAALDSSLAELSGVEVPAQLDEYKSLLTGIFTTLQKLVIDLAAAAAGQAAEENMENNPDFLYMQELMAEYVPLVQKLSDGLKISGIDPWLEKIELEINRLYLEEGE
jgi:hypothetical protein